MLLFRKVALMFLMVVSIPSFAPPAVRYVRYAIAGFEVPESAVALENDFFIIGATLTMDRAHMFGVEFQDFDPSIRLYRPGESRTFEVRSESNGANPVPVSGLHYYLVGPVHNFQTDQDVSQFFWLEVHVGTYRDFGERTDQLVITGLDGKVVSDNTKEAMRIGTLRSVEGHERHIYAVRVLLGGPIQINPMNFTMVPRVQEQMGDAVMFNYDLGIHDGTVQRNSTAHLDRVPERLVRTIPNSQGAWVIENSRNQIAVDIEGVDVYQRSDGGKVTVRVAIIENRPGFKIPTTHHWRDWSPTIQRDLKLVHPEMLAVVDPRNPENDGVRVGDPRFIEYQHARTSDPESRPVRTLEESRAVFGIDRFYSGRDFPAELSFYARLQDQEGKSDRYSNGDHPSSFFDVKVDPHLVAADCRTTLALLVSP